MLKDLTKIAKDTNSFLIPKEILELGRICGMQIPFILVIWAWLLFSDGWRESIILMQKRGDLISSIQHHFLLIKTRHNKVT